MSGRTIPLRVVRRGNPALQKLARHLRNIESRSSGIFARDNSAGNRVIHARPYGALLFSKIARISLHQMRQKTIDKEAGSNLVSLSRAIALCIGVPALPIVR